MSDLQGKRIWVMAKGYTPDEGGMQTYARAVAGAYAARGAAVTVVTQTSAGPRRAVLDGVDVIDIGPGKSPLVLWKFWRALQTLKRRVGAPDFLHATTWRTAVPPMLLGLPYAVTFHGREFMYARGIVLGVMRRVARNAVRRVAVSRFSAEKLSCRLGDGADIAVAWNGTTPGLPLAAANQGDNDPPLILSLCRLEPRKNIRKAVLAAAHCRNIGLDFRFVICGRGPDFDAIAALAEDLRLSPHVEVAGFVDKARADALYASADIFLHPQVSIDDGHDFEGFGIAIADAMYCGQAVIVGAAGGSPELVVDGLTGLIVDGEDANAVARALAVLLTDHRLRRRIGRRAAVQASIDFRWDRHVRIVMGLCGDG